MCRNKLVFKLEWTQVCGRNGNFQCTKGNNSKVCNPELRLLDSAVLRMMLHICVKFHENIPNSFDVTERTRVCGRNGNFQYSKGNNSKSMQSIVTALALCM